MYCQSYPNDLPGRLKVCKTTLNQLYNPANLEGCLEAFESSPELLDVNDPLVAQPLCTALQIALVVLLRSWGINPTVTIGHSSGIDLNLKPVISSY